MTTGSVFWLAIGGLFVTCLTATGAKALREFSRHQLEIICRARDAQSVLGDILRLHDRVALGVESARVLATALLVGSGIYWLGLRFGDSPEFGQSFFVVGIAGGLVTLLAAEVWIPGAVVRLWAEPFLFHTWRLWILVSRLATPLVICARFVDTLFHRLAGRTRVEPDEESFEEEIRTIVTEGHREGLLEEDAREMIEGVIELSDADVSELMTPRTDMICMHVGLSLEKAVEFATKVGHSRIPVYEKNRDDIIGILYAKDLLPELARDPADRKRSLRGVMREPYFVPETKPPDALLHEFQRTRNHMAVVLDEYGGVSGLVTIEDVLEEIVGEIVDEYDAEVVEGIRRINDKTCEVRARVHIDELNERLDIELPEDGDYDTVGGFVFTQIGHIPKPGEEVSWNNVRITVLDATQRRIERLRVEILDEPQRATA